MVDGITNHNALLPMMSEENQRPPLPKQKKKERRRRSSNSRTRPWRESDDSPSNPPLQPGVDAASFHTSSQQSSRRVRQALKDASVNVVKQKRQEVSTALKLQRAAFKQVTSLKTWPLQELAVENFNQCMAVHHGEEPAISSTTENADSEAESLGDSTGLSSSSLDEPKRTRRQSHYEDLSPRKSTLRHQFLQDFVRERALKKPCDADLFQTALWSMEPRMFAVEKSTTGKRRYMAGHLGRFLDYYWGKVDPKHRHYYELIREKTPCRLYFDLEFSKEANPDISDQDSAELLEDFIAELSAEFQRIYDMDVHRSCIVELDSSTCKKFSRHLVVHLPNDALFESAIAAGRFVRVLVGRLAEEAATGRLEETRPALAKHLFVNTKPKLSRDSTESDGDLRASSTPQSSPHNDTTCFVDMGVYTRNRLFRLLGSSKYGRPASAALRISDSNTFPFPEGFTNESFYVPDMEKRVKQRHDEVWEDNELDMEAEIKKFQLAMDWTNHSSALAETLVVPMNSSKLNLKILEESEEAKALIVESPATKREDRRTNVTATGTTIRSSSSVQHGYTPYPAVDNFIENNLGCRGGVQGSIRAWSVENDVDGMPQCITYQLSRNRFCERLGRPHKSNNIMWTVDLQTMQCTQACHDPDCRALRYRGTPVDLPEAVRESVADALFEQQLATMDEKELLEKPPIPKEGKEKTTVGDDFDEAEFERALLALNIHGDEPSMADIEESTHNGSKKRDTTTDVEGEHMSTGTNPSFDEPNSLSDESLLAAVASNPNLFP